MHLASMCNVLPYVTRFTRTVRLRYGRTSRNEELVVKCLTARDLPLVVGDHAWRVLLRLPHGKEGSELKGGARERKKGVVAVYRTPPDQS